MVAFLPFDECAFLAVAAGSVGEGDDVTVGIYVRCKGAGNGAWGKIDDGMLNSVAE